LAANLPHRTLGVAGAEEGTCSRRKRGSGKPVLRHVTRIGAIANGKLPGREKATMKILTSIRFRGGLRWWLLSVAVIVPSAVQAQSWQATAGAQSSDRGTQALAFLPNEIWVHAGDTVTWILGTDEPHTVTFLKPGQVRPSFLAGCPGATPDGSAFDGSACVNSGRVTTIGQTYAVSFPTPGNYRLVCLIHANMTGIVHVLDASEALPHDQGFYDDQAGRQTQDLLSDLDSARGEKQGNKGQEDPPFDHGSSHGEQVTTGSGELVSTTGGFQSVSVMRFMQPSVTIHAGDTVEWNSQDVSGHTITFGAEPPNVSPATPPSANVFVDADGARHAIITSTSDNVHSGFIAPAPQERVGLPQSPSGVTRFRVTFPNPGTYPYFCAFHDDLGMKGVVIVLP
jgi:plastocyanin